MKNQLIEWRGILQGRLVDLGEGPPSAVVEEQLRQLGTCEIQHSHGRSLFDHLVGTGRILSRWSCNPFLVRAGYFHSIYSTDRFPISVVPKHARSFIRSIIGAKAEALVYVFCSVERNLFFRELENIGQVRRADHIRVALRIGTVEHVEIGLEQAAWLLMLYAANLSDQSCGPGGRPTKWLVELQRILKILSRLEGHFKVPFECDELLSLTPSKEICLLEAYRFDNSFPRREVTNALKTWLGEVWIAESVHAIMEGDLEKSTECATSALEAFLRFGMTWDKRLEFDEWVFLAKALAAPAQDREPIRELAWNDASPLVLHELCHHRVGARAALTAVLNNEEHEVDSVNLASPRLAEYFKQLSTSSNNGGGSFFPSLESRPVWTPNDFPLCDALEASAVQVAAEVMALEEAFFHAEGERIGRSGTWNVFMLYERGRKNAINCSRCPTLSRIVERYNTVRTPAGLIYVSKMGPQTRIAAHRGPTNLRLRCHLGIKVPPGDCGLSVNGEKLGWAEGKCIVFDDYYEHEAWNSTAEDRIVIVVDLWHPDLTKDELQVVQGVQQNVQRQAENLNLYWQVNSRLSHQRRSSYD